MNFNLSSINQVRRIDFLWITSIAGIVIVVDILTKIWIYAALRGSPPIQIIPGCLRLNYGENTGIAFGLFQEHGNLFHFLSPFAFVILIVLLYKQFAHSEMNLTLRLIFGLLLGGAMGNILNRFYSGYVIDFIEAYIGNHVWPTFNVADSALTVGEVLLVWKLLFSSPQECKISEPEIPGEHPNP